MSAALQSFETRLTDHFTELAATKKKLAQPVFSLEHCLTPAEVTQLASELGTSLRKHGMSALFSLSWVVHAAEHGYRFDGQEFWYSFAEHTPNWATYGNRDDLRAWYEAFANKFSGVKPSGQWGKHFTYIAWPITNALLPRDLQVQLAKSIYEIRYNLKDLVLLPPEGIGQMIARHSYWPTSRYRVFLQQHDLVGRVVQALLQGEQSEQSTIYGPTLSRIINDLNSKGNARAWLRDAQSQYAKQQIKLGPATPTFSLINHGKELDYEADADTHLHAQGVLLKPKLSLLRVGESRWAATVIIPPFQALVNVRPEFKDHLSKVRFSIPSHGDALFPGLSLLSGRATEKTLRHWPVDRRCLLEFTAAENFFDAIVTPECQLSGPVVWLFRDRGDGTAVQVLGQHIRGGESYLILARDADKLPGIGQPIKLTCEAIFGAHLQVPPVVPEDMVEKLKEIGIVQHSTLRIDPVGLMPRQWSEQGTAEWLSTETPCLGISRDHEFDSYLIKIDDGAAQEFASKDSSAPALFLLDGLSVGQHDVCIATSQQVKTKTGSYWKTVASFNLQVYIRAPTVWSPGRFALPAMVVDTDPAQPSIDDVLAKKMVLRAEGDSSRTATCTLVFTDATGAAVSKSEILRHRLPISADLWSARLSSFLAKPTDEQTYLTAAGGYVSVDAEDLGEFRVPLHHDPKPLRWALRSSKTQTMLRLINDGVEGSLELARHDFVRPIGSTKVSLDDVFSGIDVRAKEGLYVVSHDNERYAVVVSPITTGHGFEMLGANVDLRELRKTRDLPTLVDRYALWSMARPCGSLSQLKQSRVVRQIHNQIVAIVCGTAWEDQEARLRNQPSLTLWEVVEGTVQPSPSYAITLVSHWHAKPYHSDEELAQRYFEVTRAYHITSDLMLMRAAWLMATDPSMVYMEQPGFAIRDYLKFGLLVRAARLLWLCKELGRKAST